MFLSLQNWLHREVADVLRRQRHVTSLGVELWKALGDRSDERVQAKLFLRESIAGAVRSGPREIIQTVGTESLSEDLYPYLGERVKKARTLNDKLAENVELLRPDGDEGKGFGELTILWSLGNFLPVSVALLGGIPTL